MTKRLLLAMLLLLLQSTTFAAVADEQAELERMLHAFLAGAGEQAVHERFWAEDLIYTSSSGQRFGKDRIMAGFEEAAEEAPAGPSYGGEEVNIRVMGDIAVITFRLFAEQDGERIGEYFNTGIFRKEGGEWRAFTWQATRIPPESEANGDD
ncbi:nuclear transport factor 2 family protein [Wenzhouxiangella marina]|uniref:SnoaL-like domain protein n=1 Tax=Wenzhouxiangella marina TaxID=1579979 RepID=A0A0K0XU61_9GAMM|nr:nuclear transport factor 2 family protein [Wenzhouxiangella marina]AKS41239.1 SnoaL-like domain protein [Wenzhouxiangella marina]MBB6088119.1 ketosteroid isomerase-like protein [Wenzhouxiangella marina]